jgi:hypothetical protein
MTDDSSAIRKLRDLLAGGPLDPRMLARYDLFAEFRTAMERKDQAAQLEIAGRLKRNAQEIDAAKKEALAAIATAIDDANATTDPDERTTKLLKAFALSAKTTYWAFDAMTDNETGKEAMIQTHKILAALDAIPPGRRSALTTLLDDPDVNIRCVAAIHLQKIMPERVNPILRQIDQEESPSSVGLAAMWALPTDPNDPSIPPARPRTPSPNKN